MYLLGKHSQNASFSLCIFLRDAWESPWDADEEGIVVLKLFVSPGRGLGTCIFYTIILFSKEFIVGRVG